MKPWFACNFFPWCSHINIIVKTTLVVKYFIPYPATCHVGLKSLTAFGYQLVIRLLGKKKKKNSWLLDCALFKCISFFYIISPTNIDSRGGHRIRNPDSVDLLAFGSCLFFPVLVLKIWFFFSLNHSIVYLYKVNFCLGNLIIKRTSNISSFLPRLASWLSSKRSDD